MTFRAERHRPSGHLEAGEDILASDVVSLDTGRFWHCAVFLIVSDRAFYVVLGQGTQRVPFDQVEGIHWRARIGRLLPAFAVVTFRDSSEISFTYHRTNARPSTLELLGGLAGRSPLLADRVAPVHAHQGATREA